MQSRQVLRPGANPVDIAQHQDIDDLRHEQQGLDPRGCGGRLPQHRIHLQRQGVLVATEQHGRTENFACAELAADRLMATADPFSARIPHRLEHRVEMNAVLLRVGFQRTVQRSDPRQHPTRLELRQRHRVRQNLGIAAGLPEQTSLDLARQRGRAHHSLGFAEVGKQQQVLPRRHRHEHIRATHPGLQDAFGDRADLGKKLAPLGVVVGVGDGDYMELAERAHGVRAQGTFDQGFEFAPAADRVGVHGDLRSLYPP